MTAEKGMNEHSLQAYIISLASKNPIPGGSKHYKLLVTPDLEKELHNSPYSRLPVEINMKIPTYTIVDTAQQPLPSCGM